MLLAPVNNASPPFCCPTHLEEPCYDDTNTDMPLVESICRQCQDRPSGEMNEVSAVRGTLSATAARYRTNEASSEGETSEYDEDDETTIDDPHSKSEDNSEDCSSSAAFDEGRITAQDVTVLPERDVKEEKTSPTLEHARSHLVLTDVNPSQTIKKCLPSALRKNTRRIRSGVTRRRVRGLWGSHEEDSFAQLHDDLLQRALSYLSLADIRTVSMVSKRWNYMANKETTFQTVDATEFVQRAFSNFCIRSPPEKAARETAQALSDVLENHTPKSLTICNIGAKLCPDTYLPCLKGLQHLKLEHFTRLTDTHIHVWMLSSTAVGQGRVRDIHLRNLELEHCTKLSNATVKTIARHCPALQGLSLAGNERVDDLSELTCLWRVEGQQSQSMQRSSSNLARMSTSSLRSLEAPLFPGPPASSGDEKPSLPLHPAWNENATTKRIGSPPMGAASPKQLLMEGGMSSVFDPPLSKKPESFFEPPKKPPRSTFAQETSPETAGSVSSLFLPPAKSPLPAASRSMNDRSSAALSGLFAPPALSPKTSCFSMSGLFSPPKATTPSPASTKSEQSSLSGLFAPPPKLASPVSSSTAPKEPPSAALFTQPEAKRISSGEPATAVSCISKPPPTNLSSQIPPSPFEKPPPANSSPKQNSSLYGLFNGPPSQPKAAAPANSSSNHLSGLFAPPPCKQGLNSPSALNDPSTESQSLSSVFVPPTANPPEIPSGNGLSGLFDPPAKSTPPSKPNGLFTPPTTPKPSPASAEEFHDIQDSYEGNGMFTPPFKPTKTPVNTPDFNDSTIGLFVPPKNPDLEPPASPSGNPAAGLESLFRPPGNSPGASPQASNRPTIHRRCPSQSMPFVGRLDRINVSGTGVSAKAVLESFQQAAGRISLTSLECKGVKQAWSENEVRELTEAVSFAKLRLLDLEYEGHVVDDVMSRYSPSADSRSRD